MKQHTSVPLHDGIKYKIIIQEHIYITPINNSERLYIPYAVNKHKHSLCWISYGGLRTILTRPWTFCKM